MTAPAPGRVYLVGAGPGDPGLLTLEGAKRLGEADVVLYDYLANETLLDHAPAVAERVCLGRHGAGKLWKQDEINARLVADALAGKTVVRLKGGDPGVFGRVAEEIAACQAAGVSFEITPGVTTAVAAGAYAGVTLTDRAKSSCVAFVTGHARGDKPADGAVDFAELAKFPGTLVIYMGVTTAPHWSRRLIEAGKPSETPVVLVRRCSLPDQETIRCDLGQLADVLAPQRVRPPLVAIIGDVSAEDGVADWFVGRPLFGATVLVTRPAGQGGELARELADRGARVLHQPAIEIAPASDCDKLDAAIRRLATYDWVLFTSRNGVDAVFERLHAMGLDGRAFGGARIAAVGPATAAALAEWKIAADLVPDDHRSEGLAAALGEQIDGKRVLLPRASRGRETLAEVLSAAGATVDAVVAYEHRDAETASPEVLREVAVGRVDWITATSPAIARRAWELLGEACSAAPAPPRWAAISPLTAAELVDQGVEAAVASEATALGLVRAIEAAPAV